MPTQPDAKVVEWLNKLENSASVRQEMSSIGESESLNTICKIIAHQITILEHYALSSSGRLGSKSNELRRIIELYNTLIKPCKFGQRFTHRDLDQLDSIMTAEFQKLEAKEVAHDFKFYVVMAKNIDEKCRASKLLDITIAEELDLEKREMVAIKKVR